MGTTEPPVFIVGALRSGTTLLRLMMDHHPQICIFGEFEYSVKWIEDGDYPSLEEYRRRLAKDRVFVTDGLSIDSRLDYASLVRDFLEQSTAQSGKPIVGATVHTNFHELPRIFPGARFIHLLRDPRDVARSCIGMGWVGNSYHGTPFWTEPVARWQAMSASLPSHQQHTLKYEDLIREPAEELGKICRFLGVPFDSAMLEYPETTTYGTPDASLIEQWRRKLSSDEVMWIESACAPLMREVGYELSHADPQPPSPAKAVQLAIQNRTSRVRRNVDVYGLPLYASWQLTKRVPLGAVQAWVRRRVQEVDASRLK